MSTAAEPLFYVKRQRIFQRPVRTATGATMGFHVCTVADGVDANAVCNILNKGKAPPADELKAK